MTIGQRDFLERSPGVVGSSTEELANLLREQNDYMANIALYLRQLNADVLTSAIVKNTNQFTNGIIDTNDHEVVFQVGGKPVEIHKLVAFSTFTTGAAVIPVSLSLLSMNGILDGIPLTPTPLILDIHTHSVHLRTNYASIATVPLVVNGPANATQGGAYLYGFTIPDWDKIRGAIRSMQ